MFRFCNLQYFKTLVLKHQMRFLKKAATKDLTNRQSAAKYCHFIKSIFSSSCENEINQNLSLGRKKKGQKQACL